MPTSRTFRLALDMLSNLVPRANNTWGALGYGIGYRAKPQPAYELIVLVRANAASNVPGHVAVGSEQLRLRKIELHSFPQDPHPGAPPSNPRGLGPGAALGRRLGHFHGTVGTLYPDLDGDYLITAAHPFNGLTAGDAVFWDDEEVGRLVHTPSPIKPDLALVYLHKTALDDLTDETPDGRRVSGRAGAWLPALGRRVTVYAPTDRETRYATILGVRMTTFFHDWAGTGLTTQHSMIMTSRCTTAGDSGTALVDAYGRAIGIASFRSDQFSFFTEIKKIDAP